MMDALLELPPHLRARLASSLESGLLAAPVCTTALGIVLGTIESGERVLAALCELEKFGITGPGAAAWIRTLDKAIARPAKPDVVWSGPEVMGLHARDTRRVYEELLGSAERSIWASSSA